MSYVALYRKWRPQVFGDVIGQEPIVKTIKNQIISNKIPHAYLFCGTRGTGKTSTAKILSKAVNCLNLKDGEPCNECEMCRAINDGTLIDVVEIDAASNTGVDNIRDLIEDVKYPPHIAKYKVYIIDEVHMLSLAAFNALLKTIEEPPEHVIFILATTDPQKVPPTILSRCQRFDFKRIKKDDMVKRLRMVANENGVLVEDKTLNLISSVSDGAMRDALSIFDQSIAMSEGKVEYKDVEEMLGLTSDKYLFDLVSYMINKDVDNSVKLVDDIIAEGKDNMQFISSLIKHFRNLLMVKVSNSPEELIDASNDTIEMLKNQARSLRSEEIFRAINIMVDAENEMKNTASSRIVLEMAVVKFCKREYDSSAETILSRLNNLEEKVNLIEMNKDAVKVKSSQPSSKKAKPVRKETKNAEAKPAKIEENIKNIGNVSYESAKKSFHDVIELTKSFKATIAALLSLGEVVDAKGDTVVIQFPKQYAFSRDKLKEPEDKKIIEECFSKVLQTNVRVDFKVEDEGGGIEESIEIAREIAGDDVPIIIED